jgi:hypothetical protein
MIFQFRNKHVQIIDLDNFQTMHACSCWCLLFEANFHWNANSIRTRHCVVVTLCDNDWILCPVTQSGCRKEIPSSQWQLKPKLVSNGTWRKDLYLTRSPLCRVHYVWWAYYMTTTHRCLSRFSSPRKSCQRTYPVYGMHAVTLHLSA